MKLDNIRGFSTIDEFVKNKLSEYSEREKNFETLFELMFNDKDNVMTEASDGYRIKKVTYGEFRDNILKITPALSEKLGEPCEGEMVGLYMSNCIEWLEIFWAILACGYTPLIMNTRLPDSALEGIISEYGVKCVISDGKVFSARTILKEEALEVSDKSYCRRDFGREVIFMSSGTSGEVKLCAYTGENFYYQICDSVKIIEHCPKIKEHYEGELKQLVLLPLCHVFGFIAVYLWFGFFSRTLVFPRDLAPDTIQYTVKRHKVTHIFAVPMVWEAVYKAATRKIKARGDKTYRRFLRVSGLVNSLGRTGDFIASRFLREVREGLFGDSIKFLISGGSNINPEVLRFFNGIGYHLVNGYGMTEIGITSVEKSSKRKIVNTGSIGAPFGCTEYSIDENGILKVRGKTRAARIMQSGRALVTDYEEWFSTGDLMRCKDGKYYADGRSDDLIVAENGENLNPNIAEREFAECGADSVCIFKADSGVVLLASVPGVFSNEALKEICDKLAACLSRAKLDTSIRKILLTNEKLLASGEFKISRRKIAERVERGEITTFTPENIDSHIEKMLGCLETELVACFAEALCRECSDIKTDDDFFRDLGGTSIDYFALLKIIKARMGIDVMDGEGARLSTVGQFAKYVEGK